MNTADGISILPVHEKPEKFERKKATKLAGAWGICNQYERLKEVDWLSLTKRRPNYLKGRYKDGGAKLF